MLFSRNLPSSLVGLADLWESRRAGRSLPARGDFSIADLRPWLGHLLLLDVIDNGADFRHRVYGSSLVMMFGIELTGRTVADLPKEMRPALTAYRMAVATRQPISVQEIRPVRQVARPVGELILPLSNNACNVDMLLAGIHSWDQEPAR